MPCEPVVDEVSMFGGTPQTADATGKIARARSGTGDTNRWQKIDDDPQQGKLRLITQPQIVRQMVI